MELWLQDLFAWLPAGLWFAGAIVLIAFFEALVGVGLIMPGSVLTVFSGWLAFQGKGEITVIMAAAGVGALLGDLTSYGFGARFGPQLWHRGLLKKRRDLLRQAEIFFIQHGGKSIFFGRFLGPIRGLVPFVAGTAKMPTKPFFLYSLISAILWGISYPGLGYLGGTSWQRAETLAGRLGLLVTLALAVTLVLGWLRRHFLPKNPERGTKPPGRGTRDAGRD